jgi:anhydro-N-acetylmuramic acid kinase
MSKEIGEVKIILPDTEMITQKESLLMALCGYLYLENIPNSFASATGATRDTVNGVIYYPQS